MDMQSFLKMQETVGETLPLTQEEAQNYGVTLDADLLILFEIREFNQGEAFYGQSQVAPNRFLHHWQGLP